MDEDKLSKLEALILAQKDEQLKREAAAEDARSAQEDRDDARIRKLKVDLEAATNLLNDSEKARQKTEEKAAADFAEERAMRKRAEQIALVSRPLSHSRFENESLLSERVRRAANGLVDMIYGK